MGNLDIVPPGSGDSTARPDVLRAIMAATRRAVEDRKALVSPSAIERRAWASPPPDARAFSERLGRSDRINVIAECKRRSPLKGLLRPRYDPASIGRSYAAAGAAALSVLTEPAFFDGALEHLETIRATVAIPLLRKDFIVDRYQVCEARCAGADAVLLIVSALSDPELRELLASARELGLAALVEVHTAEELDRALELGAAVVGVNNRDLRTQTVDVEASARLLESIPDERIAVAESGLRTAADVARLRIAGFDAFLIGEAFMRADDPGQRLAEVISEAEAVLAGATPELHHGEGGVRS